MIFCRVLYLSQIGKSNSLSYWQSFFSGVICFLDALQKRNIVFIQLPTCGIEKGEASHDLSFFTSNEKNCTKKQQEYL